MDIPVITSSTTQPANGMPPIPPRSGGSESKTTTLVSSLLINRVRPYLTAHRGKWFYRNETLTPLLINAALRGELPVGLVTTSGTGTARWHCLDADDEGSAFELALLARYLQECGSYSLFEPSRRGAHLFIFHKPIPWQSAKAYGEHLLAEAGIENVEVYPKSGELNAVRMPGTKHPKNGQIYRPADAITGESLSLHDALSRITPVALPALEVVQAPAVSPKADCTQDFNRLVAALSMYTDVTVYAPNRAKAKCLWHDDNHPSLLIKGGRFHCARPDCVWGDAHDLARWIQKGIRPPHH